MRILIFIGTLRSGGKERRLVELLSYLKRHTDYEMLVVLRQDKIDYPAFYNLDIPHMLLTENYKKKDVRLPLRFYKICKEFKPDIIHTWGAMPASVAWPTAFLRKIPHVNSQITSAPPARNVWTLSAVLNKVNFLFSDVILSNSQAGLTSHKPPERKSRVIYNGVNLERFKNLPDTVEVRKKYNINTPFSVIMVASFSDNKDFDLFVSIAEIVSRKRKDISFVCVGDGEHRERLAKKAKENHNIIFTGRINDVESLVNACDIGVLFSPNGEGLSNAIIEYMALSKPVIANDAGGTHEIVQDGINGFLVTDEQPAEIVDMILGLINDPKKRHEMGLAGRQLIENKFSVEKMGAEFLKVYDQVVSTPKKTP